MNQQTIQREISCSGVALHSGEKSRIVFKPAPADTGLVFFRSDIAARMPIPAHWKYVTDTLNKVGIGREEIEIKTVEHVLSALYGLGIDNCLIEVDNIEPPNMDGSSQHFVRLLLEAGLEYLDAPRRYFEVPHPIWLEDGEKYLVVLPSGDYRISYTIDFDHQMIRKQSCHIRVERESYIQEIARARTFGFWKDVNHLWENGLALGGSFNSSLVYDHEGVMNDSLRYEDECVRHKILDLIGDFALLGKQIRGHVIANKSGHALDISLVSKMGEVMERNIFSRQVREEEEHKFAQFRQRLAL